MIACNIEIKGLVQGVGFRPFVYRLANRYRLNGWVKNTNSGVQIKAEGEKKSLNNFLSSIKKEAPQASDISYINAEECAIGNFHNFSIISSKNTSNEITEISPDIALCDDCLNDLSSQLHRIKYPFINCTNCGPRFTIIKDLPYDRPLTTMESFHMCETCQKEYLDIEDRRFHAQPIACNSCGPTYTLEGSSINSITNFDTIIETLTDLICKGEAVAVKGLGGYFLACDANNNSAVDNLRKIKSRDKKPFAVMFNSLEAIKEIAYLNSEEEKCLLSWNRPIVIVKTKQKYSEKISAGFNTIGAMLPYMPIHNLLFDKLTTNAIVLTSGNISEEPIIIDNSKAIEKLKHKTAAILSYNRDIHNRADDSVLFFANNKPRFIRRSRGYVPRPIQLNINVDNILATGAELVNCFCIGKNNQAILSQHIGDLKNLETLEFFTESMNRFINLFRTKPITIACDLHPDYLSSKYANETGLEKIYIQHHHAHIASCMAEHSIDEKIIGVALDGTGLGDDNCIWGGEFLICDLSSYERYSHFDYIPLPGGDKAAKEPWRMALSYLYKIYGTDYINLDIPFIKTLQDKNHELIIHAIEKNINTPLSSSAGRLFDAIAAIINICTTSSFHAEAPMRLEAIIQENIDDAYHFDFEKTIIFSKTIKEIINDIENGLSNSIISAKFHNTIVNCILFVANIIRNEKNITKIALSGGTFQNKYILSKAENLLSKNNFEVFSNIKVPCNDGGLALGQLIIAGKIKEKKKKT